jgi:hypothetical protein
MSNLSNLPEQPRPLTKAKPDHLEQDSSRVLTSRFFANTLDLTFILLSPLSSFNKDNL